MGPKSPCASRPCQPMKEIPPRQQMAFTRRCTNYCRCVFYKKLSMLLPQFSLDATFTRCVHLIGNHSSGSSCYNNNTHAIQTRDKWTKNLWGLIAPPPPRSKYTHNRSKKKLRRNFFASPPRRHCALFSLPTTRLLWQLLRLFSHTEQKLLY